MINITQTSDIVICTNANECHFVTHLVTLICICGHPIVFIKAKMYTEKISTSYHKVFISLLLLYSYCFFICIMWWLLASGTIQCLKVVYPTIIICACVHLCYFNAYVCTLYML